jgi:hypothetical protein
LAPFEAQLLADPYGVVRYVAEHALQKLPGFDDFRYNYLAPAEELASHVRRAVARWTNTRAGPPSRTGENVLIDAQGHVMHSKVRALVDARDNRPVTIKE